MPDWKQEIRERLVGLRLAPTRETEIVEELTQYLRTTTRNCWPVGQQNQMPGTRRWRS
jgi:hypothetical protein